MGPAGVNTCDFPGGECRFAKVQGSAGHRYAGHIMPHGAPKPDLPELVLSSILIADENGLSIFSLCFFISSQTEPYLAIAGSHKPWHYLSESCSTVFWLKLGLWGTRPLQCERKLQKHSTKIKILGSAPVISHLVPQFKSILLCIVAPFTYCRGLSWVWCQGVQR